MALAFMRLMRKRQQELHDGRGGTPAPPRREEERQKNLCPQCGFRAKNKTGLTAHMRVHK